MKDQISTKLPKGTIIIDAFADFMRYLFDLAKTIPNPSEPNGELRWDSILKSTELALTHRIARKPSAWSGL